VSKFQKILKKIAEKEGVSVEEVYREMQIAIDIGFSSTDPVVQAAWKNISLPHGKPRPEDVIMYCAKKIKA